MQLTPIKQSRRFQRLASSSLEKQAGITLIESLVALVILAFGVLGLIGFQIQTLKDSRDSVGRSRALVAIQDISERMRLNAAAAVPAPSAVSPYDTNTSQKNFQAPPFDLPALDCTTAACTGPQLAAYDLWRWKTNVAQALPGGRAAIAPSPTDPRQFVVVVAWKKNTTDAANGTDALIREPDTAKVGGMVTGINCPITHTCHRVYVQPFQ